MACYAYKFICCDLTITENIFLNMSTSTVSKIKNICVFCGSSAGKDSIYEEVAENLGITLATKNIHLVYGGGEVGLGKSCKSCAC